MAELIACPSCHRQLQVPVQYIGQTVQCPECRHMFVATAASVSAAPLPADKPKPSRHDEAYDPPPRRRDREFDDDDDDFDLRRGRRDFMPHRGGMILALGLIALVGGMSFCVPALLGPVAWAFGSWDLRAIRDGHMDPSGESMTRTGQVCGIIATVLLVIITPLICFAFMAG